jgi:hypothetical protein
MEELITNPMNNVAIAQGSKSRAFFLQSKNFLKTYGLDKATISPSKLRFDTTLSATATQSIVFSPIATDNTNTGTANTNTLLNQSDVFLVRRMGFFLGKQVSSSNSKAVLNTFPNNLVFTTANESANLQGIYSGTFQTLINTTQIVPAMSMEQFYYVGQSQAVFLSGAGGTPTPASSWDWETVMQEVQPNPVLFGGMHTEMKIQFAESLTLGGYASGVNFLSYIAEGIRISGVSQNIIAQILKDLYKIEG